MRRRAPRCSDGGTTGFPPVTPGGGQAQLASLGGGGKYRPLPIFTPNKIPRLRWGSGGPWAGCGSTGGPGPSVAASAGFRPGPRGADTSPRGGSQKRALRVRYTRKRCRSAVPNGVRGDIVPATTDRRGRLRKAGSCRHSGPDFTKGSFCKVVPRAGARGAQCVRIGVSAVSAPSGLASLMTRCYTTASMARKPRGRLPTGYALLQRIGGKDRYGRPRRGFWVRLPIGVVEDLGWETGLPLRIRRVGRHIEITRATADRGPLAAFADRAYAEKNAGGARSLG